MKKQDINKIIKEELLRELSSKQFIKAVDDEWDIETLDLMITVIEKRKQTIQKMGDMARGGRKVVKGFRR